MSNPNRKEYSYSEKQNNSDTISRQAAIDALKGLPTWWADEGGYYGGARPPMVALLDPEDAVSAIENLPSAQPEKVKCKKCRYVYYDKEFGNYWCDRMSDPFMVEEDGYCKWGK